MKIPRTKTVHHYWSMHLSENQFSRDIEVWMYSLPRFEETYGFASKNVFLKRGSFLKLQGIRTHHPRGQWWWYIRQKVPPGQGIVGIRKEAGTR